MTKNINLSELKGIKHVNIDQSNYWDHAYASYQPTEDEFCGNLKTLKRKEISRSVTKSSLLYGLKVDFLKRSKLLKRILEADYKKRLQAAISYTKKMQAPDSPPYVQSTTRGFGLEINTVELDHNYSKPWNSNPGASNARPARLLYMNRNERSQNKDDRSNELIDVEEVRPALNLNYDLARAKAFMLDCERHASLIVNDYSNEEVPIREDSDDVIAKLRGSWTPAQSRFYAKAIRVLQADRLARFSIEGNPNEPVLRRLQINKAAKRIRWVFANSAWDMNLILWFHNLCLDHHRGQMLTSYLEALQILKTKISPLIEKLIQGTKNNSTGFNPDSLSILLKKPWDPSASSASTQSKLKKLPGNPVIIVISSLPSAAQSQVNLKRHKFWQNRLSNMGRVVNISPPSNSATITVASCVEKMISMTRAKINELKNNKPHKPIVLIGWHVGAVIAFQVSLMEIVNSVVCLGYPTSGVNGNKWEIEDSVYNCRTATLFVIGEYANCSNLDGLEDIRDRLRVDTGLIVVGGADDHLRMCQSRKRSRGVTQSMVDKSLVNELFEFLGSVLSQLTPTENIDDVDVSKKPRKRKLKDGASGAEMDTMTTDVLSQKPSLKPTELLPVSETENISPVNKAETESSPAIGEISPEKKVKLQTFFPKTTEPSLNNVKSQTSVKASDGEAAAIASAPELSSLLQKNKVPTFQDSPRTSSTISQTSSPVATTTALTLTRFLANSGIFGNISLSSAHIGNKTAQTLSPVGREKSLTACSTSNSVLKECDSRTAKPQPQIVFQSNSPTVPVSTQLSRAVTSNVKSPSIFKIAGNNTSQNSNFVSTIISSPARKISSPVLSLSQSGKAIENKSTVTKLSSILISKDLKKQKPSLGSGTRTTPMLNIQSEPIVIDDSPPCGTVICNPICSEATPKSKSVSKISLIPTVKTNIASSAQNTPLLTLGQSVKANTSVSNNEQPSKIQIVEKAASHSTNTTETSTIQSTSCVTLKVTPSLLLPVVSSTDKEKIEKKNSCLELSSSSNVKTTTSILKATKPQITQLLPLVPTPVSSTSFHNSEQPKTSEATRSTSGSSQKDNPVSTENSVHVTPVSKNNSSSSNSKTVVPTLSSTRTRRIRVPKHYDM